MYDKIVMRASDELTNIAKNIFGDIVKTAYFSRRVSGDSTSKDFSDSVYDLDEAIKRIDERGVAIDLVDGINVIIEFINGTKVEFSSTEFGNISNLPDLEEIQL